jgi:hypothetical protein
MSVTATQLIYRALRDIGCLRPGQTTATDVLNDGLTALNEHIDLDLLNPLMKYAFRPDIYNLQASLQVYNIGLGQAPPNFNASRPTDIQDANLILNDVTPFVRLPLEVVNVDKWASIRVRNIPSAIPLALYYDKNFDPTGQFATINLWPGPLKTYQLELFTSQQLQTFPDLTTALNWPPGYVLYLRKSLGVEIAPMMEIYSKLARLSQPREALLTRVEAQAQKAKNEIESYNAPDPELKVDPAFCSANAKATPWNYSIGESAARG